MHARSHLLAGSMLANTVQEGARKAVGVRHKDTKKDKNSVFTGFRQ